MQRRPAVWVLRVHVTTELNQESEIINKYYNSSYRLKVFSKVLKDIYTVLCLLLQIKYYVAYLLNDFEVSCANSVV